VLRTSVNVVVDVAAAVTVVADVVVV